MVWRFLASRERNLFPVWTTKHIRLFSAVDLYHGVVNERRQRFHYANKNNSYHPRLLILTNQQIEANNQAGDLEQFEARPLQYIQQFGDHTATPWVISNCCTFAHKFFCKLPKKTISRNCEITKSTGFFYAWTNSFRTYVIMNSSVAKHYGCKRTMHCGLIANGRSQANRDFSCVRNMKCCCAHSVPCAAKWGFSTHMLGDGTFFFFFFFWGGGGDGLGLQRGGSSMKVWSKGGQGF